MNIGFVTMYSEERIKFAAKAGFECLEIISGEGSKFDLVNMSKDEIKKIKETLDRNKIKISAVMCYPINHLDFDEPKRKENNLYFTKLISKVKELGCNIVATNTWGDKNKTVKENIPVYKKVFKEYAKVAEDNNVKIAMENCPHTSIYPIYIGNIGYNFEAFELMFDAVSSKSIGLEYDPSHLVWLGIDYIKGVYEFGERIYAVHAKDTEILKDKLSKNGIYSEGWWRYRIPGWGEVDWKKFISALLDVNYKGDIVIEHEDPVFGKDRTDEGLKLGLKYLSN